MGFAHPTAISFVELVVLVAVLARLAGLLFPTLHHHPGDARRRPTCLNNLKQIGLSLRLCAEEHGGEFPCDPASTTLGSFAMLTNQYQTSYKTWLCPSDPNVGAGSPIMPFTTNNLSYAYGGFGMKAKVHPDTPIACDRSSAGNPTGPTPWRGTSYTHKSDGGNVLHADGHVAFAKTMNPPMVGGRNP